MNRVCNNAGSILPKLLIHKMTTFPVLHGKFGE